MSRWSKDDDRSGDPRPGYFTMKLVRRGPEVPCRIVHGEQGWQAIIDGTPHPPHEDAAQAFGVFQVWLSGWHSSKEACAYLAAVKVWATAHQPDHPALHPRQPVDIATLPPVIP